MQLEDSNGWGGRSQRGGSRYGFQDTLYTCMKFPNNKKVLSRIESKLEDSREGFDCNTLIEELSFRKETEKPDFQKRKESSTFNCRNNAVLFTEGKNVLPYDCQRLARRKVGHSRYADFLHKEQTSPVSKRHLWRIQRQRKHNSRGDSYSEEMSSLWRTDQTSGVRKEQHGLRDACKDPVLPR